MPQILTYYFVIIDEHLKLKIVIQTFALQIPLLQILDNQIKI
jgi:hypothetical protein